jgi:hypothetical protein
VNGQANPTACVSCNVSNVTIPLTTYLQTQGFTPINALLYFYNNANHVFGVSLYIVGSCDTVSYTAYFKNDNSACRTLNPNDIMSADNMFMVSPVPANDYINVNVVGKNGGQISADLYNVAGSKVKELISQQQTADGMNYYKADVSDLPSGVYFYKAFQNGVMKSGKVVIAH